MARKNNHSTTPTKFKQTTFSLIPTPDKHFDISDLTHWHNAGELRWATRIEVKIGQIHPCPLRAKWASISTAGRLTRSTEPLDLPMTLGEFVIVHELVHLWAPYHGKVFKSFMSAYLPDWEEREETLREYGR